MPSRPLIGIGLKVASTLLFSAMLALVKAYSEYPLGQLVFLRSFVALLVLVLWMHMSGAFPGALHTKNLSGHLTRSLLGVASLFLNFSAFGLLPFADVTAINFASPPIILVLAALYSGEPMRGLRWAAVSGGFAGVVLMLWEHLDFSRGWTAERETLGAGLALCNAVVVAFAMIQTRKLAQTEHTGAIVFYFQGLTTLVSALVLLAGGLFPETAPGADLVRAQAWIWPAAADWLPLVLIGLLGGAAQIAMTAGFRYADASVLACFDYSSMLWALAIGIMIFGESPSALVLAGSVIVIGSGLAVVWSEGQLGQKLRAALPGSRNR